MSLPDADAPYSGGFVPGGRIFAVDGDWETWGPHGPPEISNPFEGDSVFSNRDIIYLGPIGSGDSWIQNRIYVRVPLGTAPNIQPWFPNQDSIIIDQKFRGAFSSFQPMRLNTPYNPDWALPWASSFLDNLQSVAIGTAILVREGELKDIGGGLGEVSRRFATIPKTRSIPEQFAYQFIGLEDSTGQGGVNARQRKVKTVMSRVQFDYFVFDDFPVLNTPLFPDGNRLDSTTGLYPPDLILKAQEYYGSTPYSEVETLSDASSGLGGGLGVGTGSGSGGSGSGSGDTEKTIPSLTEYTAFLDQTFSGGPAAAELVAEASCLRQWMGNIYERATRFVQAE